MYALSMGSLMSAFIIKSDMKHFSRCTQEILLHVHLLDRVFFLVSTQSSENSLSITAKFKYSCLPKHNISKLWKYAFSPWVGTVTDSLTKANGQSNNQVSLYMLFLCYQFKWTSDRPHHC